MRIVIWLLLDPLLEFFWVVIACCPNPLGPAYGKPPPRSRDPDDPGPTFDSQLPEEPFDLITRQRRQHLQHLQQIPDRCPFRAAIGQMPHQQRLVGLPIQAALPCIGAGTAERRIEGGTEGTVYPVLGPVAPRRLSRRDQEPCCAWPPSAAVHERWRPGQESHRSRNHEFLVAKSFQEAHERRIPDTAFQRQTNLVGRALRRGLASPEACFVHEQTPICSMSPMAS